MTLNRLRKEGANDMIGSEIDYMISIEFGASLGSDELKQLKKEFKQRLMEAFLPEGDNPFGPGTINVGSIKMIGQG